MRNEVYIGTIVCNKHQKTSYKSKELKPTPETEWIRSKDMHEPIVEKKLYENVKLKLDSKVKRKVFIHNHIFKGMIRCQECGNVLVFSVDKRRDNLCYYVCSTYRRYGKSRCTTHYIKYQELIGFITEKLKKLQRLILIDKKKVIKRIVSYKCSNLEESCKIRNTSRELNLRLGEINAILKKAYEDYVLERISIEDFNRLSNQFNDDKNKVKTQLDLLDKNVTYANTIKIHVQNFVRIISKLDLSTQTNRKKIDSVIEKIEVSKNGIIIYYKNIGVIE